MKARSYTTKIELWKSVPVDDGFGGWVNSDQFVKKVWANKNTSGAGFKFQQYGLNDFKNPIIFAIRGKNKNIDFSEKTFVIYKGLRFEVRGFEDVDFDGLEINLICDAT